MGREIESRTGYRLVALKALKKIDQQPFVFCLWQQQENLI
jgi:hypothetical protein